MLPRAVMQAKRSHESPAAVGPSPESVGKPWRLAGPPRGDGDASLSGIFIPAMGLSGARSKA